jgi:hypothetical protein
LNCLFPHRNDLTEVKPKSIRLRKSYLDSSERKRIEKQAVAFTGWRIAAVTQELLSYLAHGTRILGHDRIGGHKQDAFHHRLGD